MAGTETAGAAAAAAPRCHIVDHDGPMMFSFDRESIERRLEDHRFFWLDLHGPTGEDIRLLRDVFGFHPLAIEDAEHFHQRPKFEDYDGYVFMVVYGAVPDADLLVEVHLFYSERYLITLHRDDSPAFSDMRARYAKLHRPVEHGAALLYQAIDALVDSFFPVLAAFDDRIDDLEDEIFRDPSEECLQTMFSMKRELVGVRKVITPQRDMFAQYEQLAAALPGASDMAEHYYRDVYDHLIRMSDFVDSYRDLLSNAMDVYLSTVSNRLNVVMKQLTVIATIFLPLTFVTGFFGQNFGWLVGRIGGYWSFVLFGVLVNVAIVAGLIGLFKRRGWF